MPTIVLHVDQISFLDASGVPLSVYTGKDLYEELIRWVTALQIKKASFKVEVR